MQRRYCLYLETSFWKRLGDPLLNKPRKVSFDLLRQLLKRHRILVSDLVLREVTSTPDMQERRHIVRRIWGVRPRVLTESRKAEQIALELLESGGWGMNRFADMAHIGYAVLGHADALVTWDKGDLARDRTRNLVTAYCKRKGLESPLIGTPEEVARWLGIRIRS